MDYNFTVKKDSAEDAERVFEEFEAEHYTAVLKLHPQYVFSTAFRTNKLPALQFRIAPEENAEELANV